MHYRTIRGLTRKPGWLSSLNRSSFFLHCNNRTFFGVFKGVQSAEEILRKERAQPIQVNELGEKIVYESNQRHQIRALLGAGGVSTVYWLYHLANCYFYEGVVVNGIDLGGNPLWGYIGLGVSALILATSREFSKYTVYRAYVSADGFRVGFQVHSLLGGLGRKFEAMPINMRIESSSRQFIPVSVVGMDKPVLVDTRGNFYGNSVLQAILIDQKIPEYLKVDGELVKSTALLNSTEAVTEATSSSDASAAVPVGVVAPTKLSAHPPRQGRKPTKFKGPSAKL